MKFDPPSKYMNINVSQAMQDFGKITTKFIRISNFKLPKNTNSNLVSHIKKSKDSDCGE